MNRYQSSLLLARVLRTQYLHLHTSQCNVVTPSQGRPRSKAFLMSSSGHCRSFLDVRHYSSGFLGAERIPRSSDDVHSNGGYGSNPLRHQLKYINAPYNANILPQQQMSAAGGISGQNDENVGNDGVESTLEELDAFCIEWDLERAVRCMQNLGRRGIGIDFPLYLALINACGEARALEEAKAVHEHLLDYIFPVSTHMFNRMLEMYGKCGSMNDAYDMFNKMAERNLTSWDNMIGWYAKNGLGEEAIDMFTKLKEAGLKPDSQMFFGVLDACGVVGDITEGMLHFDSMSKIYGITPTMGHYASIVRMFGSAGDLDGAFEFMEKLPVEPSIDVWESLMNVSRIQGDVDLGDRCAQIVEQLDPSRLMKESQTGLLPIAVSDTPKKKVRKASVLNQTNMNTEQGTDHIQNMRRSMHFWVG